MRVLIDTNVFISYLLNPHRMGTIQAIFTAWSAGKFTLLVPEALLDEILVTVSNKPHLAQRISPDLLKEFLSTVQELGETVPRIESPIPAVTRDPKDDYLLAYALVGKADYLVTGDEDLLA
ncbi:MAG: putative toxin-antitoxin system toxin component, PIN family, partial [Anaerolineae bacterium]